MEKIIVELEQSELVEVAGGVTLSEKTVSLIDWNLKMIPGCCTQGCCDSSIGNLSAGWE